MWLAVLGIFVCSFPSRQVQSLLGLAEGESCKDALEGEWTCTTLEKCSHVDVTILQPKNCSFQGQDPIICCPPAKNMTKSEISCRETTKQCLVWRKTKVAFVERAIPTESSRSTTISDTIVTVREHGTDHLPLTTTVLPETLNSSDGRSLSNLTNTFELLVVGGVPALPKIHKHMSMIGYGPENKKTWNCGGSLISDLWILSAAHCTNPGGELGVARWARLGELDWASTTDDARPQEREIVQRINHPEYKTPQMYHDLALYKLSSAVSFDAYVAPICLHTSFDIKEPKATVPGWGRIDFAGEVSSHLLEAEVTLISHTECEKLWGNGDQFTPQGIDRLAMLCAAEKEGGVDACSGDSGGPLVANLLGCPARQVGITSFGRDCGLPNSPAIYTRVSTYVTWIESVVWP